MTEGPILSKLIRYSIPLIVINVTQMLFSAIDVSILGQFGGDASVAAVGTTGSLIQLITGLFFGLASGVNVAVAHGVGAKDMETARRATGTAIVTALICGLMLMAVSIPCARIFLLWMKCDPAVIDLAVRYLRIYFLGMSIMMAYNFIAAALRASGDSLRPMIVMLTSGVVKVLSNLILVGGFKLEVTGAALSTIISQSTAMVLMLLVLSRSKLSLSRVRVYKAQLTRIVQVGIPSGMCSLFFYAANVVIQTAVNSLGTVAMTANTIATQYDSFVYVIGSAFAATCMAFVGQNMGARNLDRVKQGIRISVTVTTVACTVVGLIFVLLSGPLCTTVSSDPEVIAIAKQRMLILCMTYFTSGIMEILSLSLSSMGWFKVTMVVGFFCGLGARVLWTWVFWPMVGSLAFLYVSYPISNVLAIIVYLFVLRCAVQKLSLTMNQSETEAVL